MELNMLLSQLFERAVKPQVDTSDVSTFTPHMGSKQIHVGQFITPEESKVIDVATLPKQVVDFPVMYVYVEPMAGNVNRQDALKMRKQGRFQTPEHQNTIQQLVTSSIQTAVGYNERGGKYQRQSQNVGSTALVARALRGEFSNVAVVPLPSSSQLSTMIATGVAEASGGEIVQALQKSSQIKFSPGMAQRFGLPPRDPRGDMHALQMELQSREETFANLPKATTPQMQKAQQQLAAQIERLEQKIADLQSVRYSQKSMYSNLQSARGRVYHGHFSASENARALNGKLVIIVDDNVYSGQTFAEAVKALVLAGVRPKAVVGFVLHQFE